MMGMGGAPGAGELDVMGAWAKLMADPVAYQTRVAELTTKTMELRAAEEAANKAIAKAASDTREVERLTAELGEASAEHASAVQAYIDDHRVREDRFARRQDDFAAQQDTAEAVQQEAAKALDERSRLLDGRAASLTEKEAQVAQRDAASQAQFADAEEASREARTIRERINEAKKRLEAVTAQFRDAVSFVASIGAK